MITNRKNVRNILAAFALLALAHLGGSGVAFAQGGVEPRLEDALQVSALSSDNRNPAIAFSPDGNQLFVAWDGIVGENRRILMREQAGGEWLPPVIIDSNPAGDNRFPSIAIDANGTPHVAWVSSIAGKRRPLYARRLARFPNSWFQQTLPFPADSTTVGNSDYVNLQLNSDGRPWIVWQYGFGNVYSVVCTRLIEGGQFASAELSPGALTHNLYPELFFLPEPTVYWYLAQSDQFYLIGSRLDPETGDWQVAMPENLSNMPADNLPDLFRTATGPLAGIWYDRQVTATGVPSDRIFLGLQNSETQGRGEVIDQQQGASNTSVAGSAPHDTLLTSWISETYEDGAVVYMGVGDSPDSVEAIRMSEELQSMGNNPKVAGSFDHAAVAWEEKGGMGVHSSEIVVRIANLN